MEKAYKLDLLDDLLPHYKFYRDKGISEDILRLYKSGFATKGKMNNRYVFPILDSQNEKSIIGFSGRSMIWDENSSYPKWKHIGSKKNWIYPLCLHKSFVEECEDKKEIIIVESIGDSLALTQNKMKNHIVVFGVDLSTKQIMSILALEPEVITISMNNDKHSKSNVGLISSIRHFVALMDFFDIEKIRVKLPNENDLSSAHELGVFDDWANKKVNNEAQLRYILKFLSDPVNKRLFMKKAKINSKIEKIKFHLDSEFSDD